MPKKEPMMSTSKKSVKLSRRRLLQGGVAAAAAGPMIWLPNPVYAQQCTARGAVKHLIYMHLGGGFRFTTAFNGDVSKEFNPFGPSRNTANGTEWGPSTLLEGADWLEGTDGEALAQLGMRRVTDFSDEMMVLATVDHEPTSGNADGNHGTGLERFNTGYVAGENGIFTMLNYGLRAQIEAATAMGEVLLPPFVLGNAGMARGGGALAAYRPPVISGDGFDNFVFASKPLPDWATQMAGEQDQRMMNRQIVSNRSLVEAYMGTRESTRKFSQIFASEVLKVRNNSDEKVDGISNRQLAQLFGDSGAGRQMHLALRLFHYGCPAVTLDQGGYDMHSMEDENLPKTMMEVNRLLSALNVALKQMEHKDGGTYWDHTLIMLGSEFGRTARGESGFNSAGGSDHGGDLATRWMSMPFMGGAITSLGLGGKQFGVTAKNDLKDDGVVFSYRSVMKTMMDLLCADHSEIFTEDAVIKGIF
jgi:Protein of unknown function (DUF1501)